MARGWSNPLPRSMTLVSRTLTSFRASGLTAAVRRRRGRRRRRAGGRRRLGAVPPVVPLVGAAVAVVVEDELSAVEPAAWEDGTEVAGSEASSSSSSPAQAPATSTSTSGEGTEGPHRTRIRGSRAAHLTRGANTMPFVRYVVCVPDGASDEPLDELGGRTPLEAASMPNLARLAARGEVGRAATIPRACRRAATWATCRSSATTRPATTPAGRRSRPPPWASTSRPGRSPSAATWSRSTTRRHHGRLLRRAHRHRAVPPDHRGARRELGGGRDGDLLPPRRHVPPRHGGPRRLCRGRVRPAPRPDRPGRRRSRRPGRRHAWSRSWRRPRRWSAKAAAELGASATQVWLWGQGTRPALPASPTAVRRRRPPRHRRRPHPGPGRADRHRPRRGPEGVTGYYDTNYEGKRDAALASLADRDLFLLHVEASDEAGHNGEVDRKIEALENWDRRIIGPAGRGPRRHGPVADAAAARPPHAVPCCAPTPPTPCPTCSTTRPPTAPAAQYTESATADCTPVVGHHLMARLIGREPRWGSPQPELKRAVSMTARLWRRR